MHLHGDPCLHTLSELETSPIFVAFVCFDIKKKKNTSIILHQYGAPYLICHLRVLVSAYMYHVHCSISYLLVLIATWRFTTRRYGTSCDLGLTSHHTVCESESIPRADLMLRVSDCVLLTGCSNSSHVWWPRRSLSDSRFPIAYSHSALRIPIYHSGFAFGIAYSHFP